MNEQFIPPHELAAQLRDQPPEVVDGRVESALIAEMLDRAKYMEHYFRVYEFEQNEFGHVEVSVAESPQYNDGPDELHVTFVDPYERRTLLGGIRRLPDQSKATTIVMNQQGEEENLLPADPRWDAVVGVLDRAIEFCKDNPFEAD